ncbi:MAG: transcriptional regulator [Bacteroidetes bacterium 4572_114]|nr:MAG: transcriptional regulator [Bacteroidetes bacterium 4572_114]
MKKNKETEPTTGVLTNRMDTKTNEFDQFQAILLTKSKERSEKQKRHTEIMSLKFKMEDYLESEGQDISLADLKALQIQQNKFADYIGLKPSNLSKLINGERPINYEMALIFGEIFNIDPMLWIEIQAKNELKKLKTSGRSKYQKYSLSDLIAG